MKSLLPLLLLSAITLIWPLGISGVLALLGIWKRANASAKLGIFTQASAILEAAVETSVHGLDVDGQPILAKVRSGQLTLADFGRFVLGDLKTQGQTVMVPALAKALGVTVQALEDLALSKALAKTGLTATSAPAIQATIIQAAAPSVASAPVAAHP